MSAPSSRRAVRVALVPVVIASLAVGAVACGSSSTTTDKATASTTAAPAGSSTTAGTTSGTGAGSATTAKVSANTATRAELEAALTAAGVPNAAKWANEIEEYRPYAADDPKLTQLRKALAKYNPSADQLEKIMSVLEP